MLVLRFLLFFGIISVAVSLGVYLVTRDKRYLRFSWQLFKLAGLLLVLVGAAIALGRLVLP